MIPEAGKKLNIFLIHKTIATVEVEGCNNLEINFTSENILDVTIKNCINIQILMTSEKKFKI